MLATARLIGRIGIGTPSMAAFLYISEISPPEVRGTLVVLEEFVSGIVVAFWITYGTRFIQSNRSWSLPFLLQMVSAFVLGAGIYFLPFSPRWLVLKDRSGEALQSLSKLRRLPASDPRVKLEHLDIQVEVLFHKEISAERYPHLQDESRPSAIQLQIVPWLNCFRRGCWRRPYVGVLLVFFQHK
jgi:MFS family permease